MKKNNKYLTFILILIITGLVLYFSLKDNYKLIIKQILSIKIYWLIMAVALLFLYYFLRSIVTHTLASKFNHRYSYKKAVKLNITTQFFHAVTPFATGGQPYEIYALKKDGLKLSDATNVSIQSFISYQIALVLLGIFALIYSNITHVFSDTIVLNDLVYIGFGVNLFVITALFILSFSKKTKRLITHFIIDILEKLKIVKNKDKAIENWDNRLNNFNDGASFLLKNKRDFIKIIILNFLALVSLYLIPLAIIYGLNDYSSLNPINTVMTSAYVMLIGAFVPTPGGTGGLEYSFIKFFSTFIKGTSLNAIMLLWRFITYYFGMILGAILLNIRKEED